MSHIGLLCADKLGDNEIPLSSSTGYIPWFRCGCLQVGQDIRITEIRDQGCVADNRAFHVQDTVPGVGA